MWLLDGLYSMYRLLGYQRFDDFLKAPSGDMHAEQEGILRPYTASQILALASIPGALFSSSRFVASFGMSCLGCRKFVEKDKFYTAIEWFAVISRILGRYPIKGVRGR